MKSPLLIGANVGPMLIINCRFHLSHSSQLSAIKPEELAILKNQEIIAINQDPVVGESISPFRWGTNVVYQPAIPEML
jgi:hypothetical protein